MLLLSSPPAARHVIDAAFDRQGRGRQLVSTSYPVVLSLYSYQCFLFYITSDPLKLSSHLFFIFYFSLLLKIQIELENCGHLPWDKRF